MLSLGIRPRACNCIATYLDCALAARVTLLPAQDTQLLLEVYPRILPRDTSDF